MDILLALLYACAHSLFLANAIKILFFRSLRLVSPLTPYTHTILSHVRISSVTLHWSFPGEKFTGEVLDHHQLYFLMGL